MNEMPSRTEVPLTPDEQRKLVIRKADEAVGKANLVLRDMRKKLDALKNDKSPITDMARKNIESLTFRIQSLETDRETILAWKKAELRKLRSTS